MGNIFLHSIKTIDNIEEKASEGNEILWNQPRIRFFLQLNTTAPHTRFAKGYRLTLRSEESLVFNPETCRQPLVWWARRASNDSVKRNLIQENRGVPFVEGPTLVQNRSSLTRDNQARRTTLGKLRFLLR